MITYRFEVNVGSRLRPLIIKADHVVVGEQCHLFYDADDKLVASVPNDIIAGPVTEA